METFIRNNIIQNNKYSSEMPFQSYIRFANEQVLIRLFHEMGFSYCMSNPTPGDFYDRATSYRIHPAYSKSLRLIDAPISDGR